MSPGLFSVVINSEDGSFGLQLNQHWSEGRGGGDGNDAVEKFDRKLNIAVIECPGGTDKDSTGHRTDSKFLVEGLIAKGANAKAIFYTDDTADSVFEEMTRGRSSATWEAVKSLAQQIQLFFGFQSSQLSADSFPEPFGSKDFGKVDAYISRVDPGEYELCSEAHYFNFLNRLIAAKVLPFNSPSDMLNLGSKKSLLNLAGMYYFPNSTYVYSSMQQFDAFFPKTLNLYKSRVVKQNRGSKGEGVWWVKLLDGDSLKREEEPAATETKKGNDINVFSKDFLVSRFLSVPFFFSSFPSFSSFQLDAINDSGGSNEITDSKIKSPVPAFYSNLLPEFTLYSCSVPSELDLRYPSNTDHNQEKETGDDEACFPLEDEVDNDDEMSSMQIKLVEASDNHQEFMTLKQFRDSIIRGYLTSSDDASEEGDDFVVDMEYLPRIAEGEVRLILSGRNVLFVVNKQPQVHEPSSDAEPTMTVTVEANQTSTGEPLSKTQAEKTKEAFSANLGAGAEHKWENVDDWMFLVQPFIENMDEMLERMNVEHAPILWTVDFIRYGELSTSVSETADEKEHTSHFVISEINASCVGFSVNPEMGEVIAKILLDTIKEILSTEQESRRTGGEKSENQSHETKEG